MAKQAYRQVVLDFSQSKTTVLQQLNIQHTWQRDIYLFLKTFWDDSDHITVHTSGSTGIPKNILLNKQKMLASAAMSCTYFGLKADDTALLCLSANYIAGKMMLVRAYHATMRLYCVPPEANPLEKIHHSVDFCAMVPLQVRHSIEYLTQVQTLIVGGAPLFEHEIIALKNKGNNIYLTYGMTETTSHIAVRNIKHDKAYHCLGDVIVDQDDRSCLIIKSAKLLGDSQLVTNDRVTVLDQQTFIWQGRIDHVINSGGIKLFPEQIEQKIAMLVNGCFYIKATKDSILGEVVTLIHEEPLTKQQLDRINDVLTRYEKVRITIKKVIPKTKSGKILRD